MKKIIACLVLMASVAANADFLYWMYDTDSAASYKDNYTAINLYGVDASSGNATILGSLSGITHGGVVDYFAGGDYFETDGFISNTYSSYYIELAADSSTIARSQSQAYEDLLDMRALFKSGGMTPVNIAPTTFGGFTAVPEPTSGVLMLLGGMLLGLKRRRMV